MGERTQRERGDYKVMRIQELIPKGSQNSISRSQLLADCRNYGIAETDRQMRKLIEDARKESVIICLCNGKGYFIPDKSDKDKLRHYINQEHDRSIAILRNLKMANNLLADLERGAI